MVAECTSSCSFETPHNLGMSLSSSFTLCPATTQGDLSAPSPGDHRRGGEPSLVSASPVLKTPDTAVIRKVVSFKPGTPPQDVHMPAPMRKEFRVIRASPFEPLVVDRKLPKDGTISPLMVDEYYTPSHLSDELDDDDDDEEEDGSSKRKHARITDPPVDEVAIPLAAAAHQGLVKLSNDDWKKLYLTSMKELKSLHRYTCQMVEENRYLKRTLIQMQKTVYEARRSKLCTSTVLPWDIPESSPRKDAPNVSSTKSPRLFKDNV